jgi:RNA polymerase sigma factor (sigma-70 family)
MTFPDTRMSLIRRVVDTGDEASWNQFVAAYWRATCRFAMRTGELQWSDAEDVASGVFEILYRKSLLDSWLSRPEARFKTLLCTVVRHVVMNAVRSNQAAARRVAVQVQHVQDLSGKPSDHDMDAFYAIWVEELLRSAVQGVMGDYHREGKGDYFRVLYGRICEQLPVKEIAEQLGLKTTDVENYFRHARKRLSDRIELLVRKDAAYYTPLTELDAEFHHEWKRLGEYFLQHGGLEEAVRKATFDSAF